MATYLELYGLREDSALLNRTSVAVAVKAQSLLDAASPPATHVTWALAAIENPASKAKALLYYVLAKNKAATIAQITAAPDDTLQTAINGAVDAILS